LLAGSVALAAGATASGPVQVFVKNGSGPRGTILVTGAIGDYGKTLSVDKNGKVDVDAAPGPGLGRRPGSCASS
jgi:hypothetical protein